MLLVEAMQLAFHRLLDSLTMKTLSLNARNCVVNLAVQEGYAEPSEFVQRILLTLQDDDHMCSSFTCYVSSCRTLRVCALKVPTPPPTSAKLCS